MGAAALMLTLTRLRSPTPLVVAATKPSQESPARTTTPLFLLGRGILAVVAGAVRVGI